MSRETTIPQPFFLYGTAWKEEATEGLVRAALTAGFRGIDTANQRKHYYEEGVGRALAAAFASGSVKREDLFIQTKFTFQGGQDHRLPYDPEAAIADQVAQSFESSLRHLGVTALDSLVLHGPSQARGLGSDDHEAWRAMEAIHVRGDARVLGISNVSREQLEALVAFAKVSPTFVQNRCYAQRGWDAGVRDVCSQHSIVYQGFSLLTANRQVVSHAKVRAMADARRITPEQLVFAYALALGMLPLTGTTNAEHMELDLAAANVELSPDEIKTLGSF